MNIKDLSHEQLEDQIELFQDRVETMIDYISDTDDNTTRSAMQVQLQKYKMTLQFLREEKIIRSNQKDVNPKINLNDFLFKSSDHLRYENGIHISGPHGGANRAIKIENNNSGNIFTVTLYNLDGDHPVWQNNIQMSPKQMKIVETSSNKTILKGFGYDAMGSSFADYGLSILHSGDVIEKCILHMFDRKVDLEYLT